MGDITVLRQYEGKETFYIDPIDKGVKDVKAFEAGGVHYH